MKINFPYNFFSSLLVHICFSSSGLYTSDTTGNFTTALEYTVHHHMCTVHCTLVGGHITCVLWGGGGEGWVAIYMLLVTVQYY